MSHSIQRQTHAIARRARRLLIVHGLCWFVILVASVAFLIGCIDYSLRLQDRGVRIILTSAMGLTLVWGARRFVIPSLRRRFSELEVAQHVERCFPQLGDRLSSSLEFIQRKGGSVSHLDGSPGNALAAEQDVRRSTAAAESAALQQTVISETEALVRPLDLQRCLDTRATRRALLACIPLLLALGIVCGLDIHATSLAARRLVAPWNHESWPRWNALRIVEPPERIALGQDFVVEVDDARGRLPRDATIQFWFDGDDRDAVESSSMRRGDDRFYYMRTNVTRSFKYRAIGGDDDSMQWRSLEVVEPAQILDFRVNVQPPTYSGLMQAELPAGAIRVLEGSQLTISGRTNRAVKQVRLHIARGEHVEVIDAVIESGDASFAIPAWPTETAGKGQYWIEIIESGGIVSGSDTRANWEIVPDQVPTVAVSAPSGEMYFTPNATVPIRVTAADDLAIHHLGLRIGDTTIPLFAGPDTPPARDELPAHADVREITRELKLHEFSLAPNDSLEFVFVAGDYKPQTSEPVTRSITVISRQDFDYRAQEKQKALLRQLVEALRLQQATRSQVQALQTHVSRVGALAADEVNRLRASELQQQQVARLVGDNPGGAAALVAELIASLHSNQLSDSETAAQLTQFSKILEGINRQRLPELQNELVRATKAARAADGAGDEIGSLLLSAGDRQEAIANDLQVMIDRLAHWDDYRRFARDMARLLRDQQDLSARTSQLPTIGQRFDALSPHEQADLAAASGEQQELARRLDRMRVEMDRLQERIRESDPQAAGTLSNALREAAASGIAERMREIGSNVARNRLGNASQSQQQVEQALQRVLGELTNAKQGGAGEPGPPSSRQMANALEQLKTQLVDLASRQQALLEATTAWHDSNRASLAPSKMADQQRQLATDTKQAQDKPLPRAFAFALQRIEAMMIDAAVRLAEASPDEVALQLQDRSLSRLRQLLTVLNNVPTPGEDGAAARQDDASGNESTAAPDGEGPSLSVEELRLLHAMQVEIHERTVALQKQRQANGALEEHDQRELQRLATEQGELAGLLLEAMPRGGPTDEPAIPPPSKQLDDSLDQALERAGIPGFGTNE